MAESGASNAGLRVRLRKKRRARATPAKTFRDLHAAQRAGETARAGGESRTGSLSASDTIARPAPQGGTEVVINHVLV
ncbi:hypothetical protein MOX02_53200 [Methylobacterium oxalidis]|uniref:Uncharacterized protein n=1 Tax=Methylobacterium oxalidis TaxID=944322 RepID=A0A512JBE0_9HYPH|nr:hypothetical protein [Methylobacterium oxalidis]GEP07282.1 hypothetical protein MOX02_53200 [Methylobacterium oxalidis]GJE31418.1 hypothetical protein LDDCCGHA_1595 [Methylobacterium oxalidis]GLS65126.1 hypothetical protein GCM10007888_35080 [Methylobacterium oxalidis]